MNVQRSPTWAFERPEIHNGSVTSLHGRWLLLARVAWVIVALLILGLNIGAIPRYYAVLQTVCTAPVNCFDDQLTIVDMQGLHALGISLAGYAILTIALNGLLNLICIILGALLCAFMLVTFFGINTALHEGLAPLSLGWYAVVEILDFVGQMSLVLFFYLFPTGRFVPRWTRWAALLYAVYYHYDSPRYVHFTSAGPAVFWLDSDARGGAGLSLPAHLHPGPAPADEVDHVCHCPCNIGLHNSGQCWQYSLSHRSLFTQCRQAHKQLRFVYAFRADPVFDCHRHLALPALGH
jgi:hypothetical protein